MNNSIKLGLTLAAMASAPAQAEDPTAMVESLLSLPENIEGAIQGVDTIAAALNEQGVQFDVQAVLLGGQDLPDVDETKLHGWMSGEGDDARVVSVGFGASDGFACELTLLNISTLMTVSQREDGGFVIGRTTDAGEQPSLDCSEADGTFTCTVPNSGGNFQMMGQATQELGRKVGDTCTKAQKKFAQ